MELQIGTAYRTANGTKMGPTTKRMLWQVGYRFEFDGPHSSLHESDGRYCGTDRGLDIVAEWVEPMPVRAVTRQEIVPGTYGKVIVGAHKTPGWIDVRWGPPGTTADELDRAASVLTALAGALRDGN